MKTRYTYLIVFTMIFFLSACRNVKFNGNRTGNDSEFLMDYSVLNRTDFQLLKLEEGDVLDVEVVSNSGKVDIEVKREDTEVIYTGVDVPTSTFKLVISESGTYKCTVTGKSAKGSIKFIKGTE